MRFRRVVVVLACLLLAACGTEAGPKPKPGVNDPGPDALRVKLNALSVDECFTAPEKLHPKGCEKYVTELASTAGSVDKQAGAATQDVLGANRTLTGAIAAYWDGACKTEQPPSPQRCTKALSDMSVALRAIKTGFGPAPAR